MAKPTTGNGNLSLQVHASFGERPADLPAIFAYAFSRGGALLDAKPLDDKGGAKLSIPGSKEAQAVRVVLAPEIEKERLDVGEVLRRGGIERRVALRAGADLPAVRIDVHPELLRPWIGRRCTVRGTLLKRIESSGVPLQLPVCHATVDIYEVDPWHVVLPRLPDLELDRLRDILDGPWPPLDLKTPLPELDVDVPLPDPIGPVALNPQPLPPRMLNPGLARTFDPQPEPPRPRVRALELRVPDARVASLPVELALAGRAARPALERAVLARLDVLRPVLCRLFPRFVRRTRIASVPTDECGRFRTVIWRSLFDTDQPDLYFAARQRMWPGFWLTIYEPLPVACHTHWDYACGSELTLVTTHPLARACSPCPPIVAPNNWVLFMAIGNSSVWRIHGANDDTHVGALGYRANLRGLLDGARPWGGTLRPRLEFDNSLRETLGVRYYRVSYKRPVEPEGAWRPSTEAVNRHYTHEVGDDLILQQWPLGPVTVGTTPHLYEIPPALPPVGQWSIPNAVLDTQSAVFETNAVAPGTAFDGGGTPIGADHGGLWQIKVELFDAAGNQVDPEGIGIRWRVPASEDLTGTIATRDAAALGLVDAVRNCMILTVRVDNNRCAAVIGAPTLDGSAGADACGVMHYASRASTVAVPFLALQRNGYAAYNFYVQRGAVWPPELNLSGTAATSAATMPAAPTAPVGDLLDACSMAGFVEHVYVEHLATDGWTKQVQYDAHATRAFVLAPVTP